jgi:predicted XRE-type DNA-binding protein
MPPLALHLRLRRELIRAIAARFESQGLSNNQIAEQLGIAHPRAVDLREQRAERFSLDALVTLAERASLNVTLRATRPYKMR